MATRQYHQGALRVIRPHYLDDSGQVSYVIVNPGGGYLGGDRYGIDIEVGQGASLLLTTQSATKVYRTPHGHAQQDTHIRLGPGAVLEYLPDQLIAYRESTYRQRNTIHMESDSTLVMAEVVTPGWSPDGARFRFDEVRLRTDVYLDGRLEVLDHLLIKPEMTSVEDMTFLGQETHVASLLVVDRRVDQELVRRLGELLRPLDPRGLMGISLLQCPGFALRAQAGSTEDLNLIINTVVSALRQGWNGQGPVNLRKG
jgi:Urease accessory protein UreH